MEGLTRRERERLAREEEILSAAERVFGIKGFTGASMDDIASEAEFTKKTLYQYFGSKEDLYFAVLAKVFGKFIDFMKSAGEKEQTGYLKIRRCFIALYDLYREHPEVLRVINQVGHVKKDVPESENRAEFLKKNEAMFRAVAEAIEEGKSDGSIRSDVNAVKAAFSLVFLMTGFYTLLSATGDSFTFNFSLDIKEFSMYTVDMALAGLRASEGNEN